MSALAFSPQLPSAELLHISLSLSPEVEQVTFVHHSCLLIEKQAF